MKASLKSYDGWKIGGAIAALVIFFWIFGNPGLFLVAGIQIGFILGMIFYPGKIGAKSSEEVDIGIRPGEKLVFAFRLDGKILSLWEGGEVTCKAWNGWAWEPATFWPSDPFSEDAESLSPERLEKITGKVWPLKG